MGAHPVNANVMEWEPSSPFDAVLLDAPCSATGTIRRHPDIAWLKQQSDIDTLARVQTRMLDRAAGFVRPADASSICTCSLEPEEGEAQVAPFLAAHPEFSAEPIRAGGSRRPAPPPDAGRDISAPSPFTASATMPHRRRGDPAATGMDGFFAARFRRQS